MREIKFRAWDTERKRLLYWEGFEDIDDNYYIGEAEALDLGEMPIMQYTGLHDKNGKEIWEGDIVKCQDHFENTFVKPVVYEKDAFIVKGDGTSLVGYTADIQWEQRLCGLAEIEVIGNIYDYELYRM